MVGRTAVYFLVTLLRYVLMIVGMGMDWFLLLSLVSGLTVGQVGTDLWTTRERGRRGEGEEVELLNQQVEAVFDDEEEGKREDYMGAHKRSSSRRVSMDPNTPY